MTRSTSNPILDRRVHYFLVIWWFGWAAATAFIDRHSWDGTSTWSVVTLAAGAVIGLLILIWRDWRNHRPLEDAMDGGINARVGTCDDWLSHFCRRRPRAKYCVRYRDGKHVHLCGGHILRQCVVLPTKECAEVAS